MMNLNNLKNEYFAWVDKFDVIADRLESNKNIAPERKDLFLLIEDPDYYQFMMVDYYEDAIEVKDAPLNHKELVLLAIATSIDALAVGVTFAFLEVPIVESIVMIGVTTFIICIIGVVIGNFFGSRLKKKAEFAGGLILILIGLKILLEHLGIIGF